jgi:hypothetical protein
MAKTAATTDRPKALDTLIGIVEQAVAFRFVDRTPSLADLARLAQTASRCLRYDNVDEQISVVNAAVISVAKRRNLIS